MQQRKLEAFFFLCLELTVVQIQTYPHTFTCPYPPIQIQPSVHKEFALIVLSEKNTFLLSFCFRLLLFIMFIILEGYAVKITFFLFEHLY